jgi:hypothetical protein
MGELPETEVLDGVLRDIWENIQEILDAYRALHAKLNFLA